MIVVADSGSTKCDWVVIDMNGSEVKRFKTQGFNPYFHNSDFIYSTLLNSADLSDVNDGIESVYFYGAGCSSIELKEVVKNGLSRVFRGAEIDVDHDLVAASHALYRDEPLISCIIGTGSNSGYFDGQNTIEKVPALGFILGDEASGCFFGKQLLADYFYKKLPGNINQDFEESFALNWNSVRKKVYNATHANVYLASFMPFILKHRGSKYVDDMIVKGIRAFISAHITCYENYRNVSVGFVGSIAYLFQNEIQEELALSGCRPAEFIQGPIDKLVQFHIKRNLHTAFSA